jgi:dTDP-4-amino-4,6-dideoxygalactose transaminase
MAQEIITLPMYPELSDEQAQTVVQTVVEFYRLRGRGQRQ